MHCFLDQCIRWTQQKVTNLSVDRTLELGRYFRLGLNVGEEGIFTGLCAMHVAAIISCLLMRATSVMELFKSSRLVLAFTNEQCL